MESMFKSLAIGQRKKLEQQSFKLDSNVFSHKKFSSKIFCAQLQVQKLEKIILARVKIKDLNIRVDISNQGIFAVIYIHRLIKKKTAEFHGLEACQNHIICLNSSVKTLNIHHSILLRQGRSGKSRFFYGGIWSNFTL